MKRSLLIAIAIFFYSPLVFGRISVGGGFFVPFGLSSQGTESGTRNYLGAQPMIYASGVFPAFSDHFFLPEIGFIPHFGLEDEYSKSVYYFSLDLGYNMTRRFLLRYGYGAFFTRISGDGEEQIINGQTFFAPSESSSSYSSSLNVGVEWAINSKYTLRLQSYFFEVFNSDKRDVSYALTLSYFLGGR